MADPPKEVDGVKPDHRPRTGLAPWQRVVVMIGILVVLVILITLFAGGGHTPPFQH